MRHPTCALASALLALATAAAGQEAESPVRVELRAPTGAAALQTPAVSLADAVALAMEGNFGLRAQADGVTSASYSVASARARFRPKFTPSYAASDTTRAFAVEASQAVPWTGAVVSAAGVFRENTPDDAHSSDLRVTVNQPLLRGFGETVTRFDLVNTQRTLQGQQRSFALARQRLGVEVAQAFYQVVRQRRLLEVAESSLGRSLGLMEASESRQRVGLASRLDVLRAELQAEQARDAAVSAQAALESALELFRTLLGLSPSASVEPTETRLPENVTLEVRPAEILVAAAYANRLELQEAQDRIDDARRGLVVARRNLLPRFDLNVAFVQTGLGDRFPAIGTGTDQRVDFFVSTSYPVERAADLAARASAELAVAQAERASRQRELEVEGEVRGALRDLERTHKSLEVQKKRVAVADEQHRLATLRYQRGLASNFDVVDAEASLVSARTSLVSLLAEFQVARYRLLRATGELDVERDFR